ncbi:MAG: type II toxin-antitoxin system death-on-curing family toxin [Octadecabacter sp.]
MSTPVWVPLPVVIIVHDRQIARHGGASGMRDRNLLESACVRPLNKFAHGETDIPTLAAAYAYGIAKAHAFVDGNKRTAFVTAFTFLRLNGYAFRPDTIEAVRMMEDLAQDVVSEGEFSEWLHR